MGPIGVALLDSTHGCQPHLGSPGIHVLATVFVWLTVVPIRLSVELPEATLGVGFNLTSPILV